MRPGEQPSSFVEPPRTAKNAKEIRGEESNHSGTTGTTEQMSKNLEPRSPIPDNPLALLAVDFLDFATPRPAASQTCRRRHGIRTMRAIGGDSNVELWRVGCPQTESRNHCRLPRVIRRDSRSAHARSAAAIWKRGSWRSMERGGADYSSAGLTRMCGSVRTAARRRLRCNRVSRVRVGAASSAASSAWRVLGRTRGCRGISVLDRDAR